MKTSLKNMQRHQLLYALLLFVFALCPSSSLGGIDQGRKTAGAGLSGSLTNENISQRLIGTAVSKYHADTFAVIEDVKDGRQWIYREGDVVGEFLIRKILSDRLIIDRGRGEEVVKLRRSQIAQGSGTEGVSGSFVTGAIPDPEYKNGPRDRHYLIDRREVVAAFADPLKLKQNVELKQGKLFSRQRGVRISALTVESVFPAMGLRKGDLLLGVNGQVIRGPEDAVAMLQTMFEDGSQAELKVRRRARTYRIHLQDLQVR